MQWTGNRVTGRRDNRGMKTRYRGRGVPVLNEMIRIDLTELFKHIRDENCFFFFHEVMQSSLYLDSFRQNDRLNA